jgi:hypothetical protein
MDPNRNGIGGSAAPTQAPPRRGIFARWADALRLRWRRRAAQRREAWLAQSQNLADLEDRIRRYDGRLPARGVDPSLPI